MSTQTTKKYNLHTFNLTVTTQNKDQGCPDVSLDSIIGPMVTGENDDPKKPNRTINIYFVDKLDNESIDADFSKPTTCGDMLSGTHNISDEVTLFFGNSSHLSLSKNGDCKLRINRQLAHENISSIEELLIWALDHVCAKCAQSLCHSASVAKSDLSSTILIHAASGLGKTTTSLALASIGYKLIADDTTSVLQDMDIEEVRAWGIPRDIKIHRKTVAMLPTYASFIDPDMWDKNGEQVVERDTLIRAQLVANAKLLPVKFIFSLKRDPSLPLQVKKLTKFESASSFLDDNLSAPSGTLLPSSQTRLDTISYLVQHVHSYEINANAHPVEVAKLIDQQISILN